MQIINFKELISFIEDSPEKTIPKSILIKEINHMKKEAENHVNKATKRINISLIATGLYLLTKLSIISYYLLQKETVILMNLYFLDIIIPTILSIGVFLKKKTASLLLLVYFLISSYIHLDIQGITVLRFLPIFIYSYLYIQAYLANISYNKHQFD